MFTCSTGGGGGAFPALFGLCDSFRVEEGRAKQATPLQGNPKDSGFASLQGLGPHLLPNGYRRGEGFGDGALKEGDCVVGGDPLGHPQGHGQLALLVFGALQLLVADSASIPSVLVGVEEREEVSSGLEVPGPEGVREFAWVGESNPGVCGSPGRTWELRRNLGRGPGRRLCPGGTGRKVGVRRGCRPPGRRGTWKAYQ